MNNRELAECLDLTPRRVAQMAAEGMPTHSVAAAEAWRRRHLEVGRLKANRMPRVPRTAPPEGVRLDELLAAAGVDLCARLVAGGHSPTPEDASIAVSAIAVALADALDSLGHDGDAAAMVAGPLACLDGDERMAVLAQIELRIAEIRADLDADVC